MVLNFGQLYRSYLEADGTPKIHTVEIHIPDKMHDYKRMGIFGEDPIEREHHTNHIFNNLFNNIRNWDRRMDAIQRRVDCSKDPEVMAAANAMITSTKRKLKQSTINNKRAKLEIKDAIKKEEYDSIISRVSAIVNDDDSDIN